MDRNTLTENFQFTRLDCVYEKSIYTIIYKSNFSTTRFDHMTKTISVFLFECSPDWLITFLLFFFRKDITFFSAKQWHLAVMFSHTCFLPIINTITCLRLWSTRAGRNDTDTRISRKYCLYKSLE